MMIGRRRQRSKMESTELLIPIQPRRTDRDDGTLNNQRTIDTASGEVG
jgi:hypothetical protein